MNIVANKITLDPAEKEYKLNSFTGLDQHRYSSRRTSVLVL